MDAKTILIIEDDDDTRASFGDILSEDGFRVVLANSGQEGLDYLQTHGAPDLIVLDMLMPSIDGWQFLKYRAARWENVPVLVTTALGIGSKEWASSLGACGWVQKPVEPARLAEVIRKCFTTEPYES